MTHWNKKQSVMSLAHRPERAHSEPMTFQHDPKSPFNPTSFREAVGPGYGVATFRDQAELTGHSAAQHQERSIALRHSLPIATVRRRWLFSRRHRLLLLVDHLLERSRNFTQERLANIDNPQSTPNCC